MQVWVKKRSGKRVPAWLDPEDRIADLSPAVKLGGCNLLKNGEILELARKVKELGIDEGDTLEVEGEPVFDYVWFVKPDGRRFKLSGRDTVLQSIGTIKRKQLVQRTKVEADRIACSIGCIDLDDDKTLFDYNVEYGETIALKYL